MTVFVWINYIFILMLLLLFLKRLRRRWYVVTFFSLLPFFVTTMIRPALLLLGLDTPHPDYVFDRHPAELIALTLVLVEIWLVVFFVVFLSLETLFKDNSIDVAQVPSLASRGVLWVFAVALLLTASGTLGTAHGVFNEGSHSYIPTNIKGETPHFAYNFIRQLSMFGGVVCIYGMFAFSKEFVSSAGRKRIITTRALLLFGTCLLANVVMLNAYGNSTYTAFLMVVFVYGYHSYIRRLKPGDLILWGLAALVLLLGSNFLSELYGIAGSGARELNGLGLVRGMSISTHIGEFDTLMGVVRDLWSLNGSRAGHDFWNSFTSWIQQVLTPPQEGYFEGGLLHHVDDPTIQSMTIVGVWLLNFGMFGIFLGLAISAVLVFVSDRLFSKGRHDAWHLCAAATVGGFMFAGGFNPSTLQPIFVTVVPVVILGFFLKKRAGPLSQEPVDVSVGTGRRGVGRVEPSGATRW